MRRLTSSSFSLFFINSVSVLLLMAGTFSCSVFSTDETPYVGVSSMVIDVRDEPETRLSTNYLVSVDVVLKDGKGLSQAGRWNFQDPKPLCFTTRSSGDHVIDITEINSEFHTNRYQTSVFIEAGVAYEVVIKTGGIITVSYSNSQYPPAPESFYCIWADLIPISCAWDSDTKLDIWGEWNGGMQITEDTNQPGEGGISWTLRGTGDWMGMGIRTEPLQTLRSMSDYWNGSLQFLFRGTKPVKIGIKSGNPAIERWVTPGALRYFGMELDDRWHEVCIPISAFAGVNLSKVEQLFMLAADSGMGYTSNSVYHLDRIFWSKTAPVSAVTNTDWTVMVYLDGDNNLEIWGLNDMNEMEAARLAGSGIRVITLIDRRPGYTTIDGDWANTRLYEVRQDPSGYNNTIVSTRISGMGLTATGNEELNMGDPNTLKNFVQFVRQNYPSSHYALVLWNHGGGWKSDIPLENTPAKAVAWDDSSGGDCLTMPEVKNALLAALGGDKLDVIGFDACLMAMAEVAYQLKDTANVLIASEEVEWAPGWDYSAFLDSLCVSRRDTYDFARSVIDTYAAFYDARETAVTLSAVDLTKMDSYITDLNAFIDNTLLKTPKDLLMTRRTNSLSFMQYTYTDLNSFAGQFAGDPYAARFLSTAQSVILHEYSSPYFYNAYGLSIYFPTRSSDYEYADYKAGTIDFIGASRWDEFLKYFLGN